MGEAERPVSSRDGAQSPARARPDAVLTISPQEGAPASPTSSVTAALRVTAEGRFTLAVDGADVTEASRLRETMTFPRSRLEITYAPPTPMAAGRHSVAVQWPGGRYEWNFTVA